MAESELDSEGSDDAEPVLETAAPLGEIDPARSRHMWRRSGVVVCGDLLVVGTWGGDVVAYARDGDDGALMERWRRTVEDSPVTLAALGDSDARSDGRSDATDPGATSEAREEIAGIAVGGRGDRGSISLLDPADGTVRWRHDGAGDVGAPAKDSVFYWPYVVDLVATPNGETLYAAVRRYERDGEERVWHSALLAFDPAGDVRWRYEADASPISIDLDAERNRLAVGYNRCFGDHQRGLVVLDTESGAEAWTWGPETEGDRRVGDVAFDASTGDLAVTSHGDFCGYLFDADGTERWRVELATEVEREGQTLYAYPTHAVAHGGRVAFVTGNTYARESRETNARHPDEHTAFGYDADGGRRWSADTGGFVHEIATADSTAILPTAQNFRVRDADTHSLRTIDIDSGAVETAPAAGILTSAATDGHRVAAVEEPIEYHDEARIRGTYALHVGELSGGL